MRLHRPVRVMITALLLATALMTAARSGVHADDVLSGSPRSPELSLAGVSGILLASPPRTNTAGPGAV